MAQQKNTAVVVVGRVLNEEDSLLIRENFFSGLKAKISNRISESEGYFKQIVESDPANHAALYELATLYHSQDEDAVAEKYARDAVTVNSRNKWYWLLLADIYKKHRNYDQLTLVYTDLIRLEPDNDNYYFEKASSLILANKPKEAEMIYTSIEEKFGGSSELSNARQRVYRQGGDSEKAVAEINKLILENPADATNYLNQSDLYLKSGKPDKALEVLLKAKSKGIRNPFINLGIADIYRDSGKNEEATAELKAAFASPELHVNAKIGIVLSLFQKFEDAAVREQALELSKLVTDSHPTEAKAFSLYGDVLFQLQKWNAAKVAYKKSLELNNQVYQVWEQLVKIDISGKDYASAITEGEEALSLFPNQAGLYFYTAIGYAQSGKHQNAVDYLNTAIGFDPENKNFQAQIYSSLGDSYNALKKYPESDNSYNKALALNPDNTYVLNNYAYYLSLRGNDLRKAEEMSARSNKLQPGNSSFEDTYAWVLFKQKKYSDARIWIEKAISNNKNSGVLAEHYGDILYHLGERDLALQQWKAAKEKGISSGVLNKKINEKKYSE